MDNLLGSIATWGAGTLPVLWAFMNHRATVRGRLAPFVDLCIWKVVFGPMVFDGVRTFTGGLL